MTAGTQLSSLLSNRQLDQLARLRLNASRRFTNRSRGEHLAAKGGASTEFCDYRDYSPGDDLRHVDWNIFSRLHRPYVKQFHHEEEMHVAILIDASSSMVFEEKFARARQLAAGFGILGLRNMEKVSLHALRSSAPPARLRPATGRASQRALLAFLENLEAGGDAPIEQGIESFLREHRGRGAAIVLSDFLTAGDLRRAFSLLHGAGLEIFALQILGPAEIAPELTGDLRVVDSETTAHLDLTSAADVLAIYQEYRSAHERLLETLAQQRQGHFLSISAGEPFERIFFDRLRRKGWIV